MLKKEKKWKQITKERRGRVAKTTFKDRMRIFPITYPHFPQKTPPKITTQESYIKAMISMDKKGFGLEALV